jgi:hypothetical protein
MDFRIGELQRSTVFNVYLGRDEIWIDPPYQRAGDIWGIEKRQLLIDSLLNGFDVPKFYMHEFFPAEKVDGRTYKYAIIDGRQRLSAIWDFIDGDFPLADGFELINDPGTDLPGLTYSELGSEHPRLQALFDSTPLSVITIQTGETELIEEMFSRLNEAVPLSAAEKRNALRGPLPPIIRDVAQHTFFQRNVPFNNSRYRHYDLACKFLYLSHKTQITDLKKPYLDEFVIDFRERNATSQAAKLQRASTRVLNMMSKVFVESDPLLRSVGMVTLFYALFMLAALGKESRQLSRSVFTEFENARARNRHLAERDVTKASYELLEFDRLGQSPNDGIALTYRYEVLASFVDTARSE